jgi:hypothetical protein
MLHRLSVWKELLLVWWMMRKNGSNDFEGWLGKFLSSLIEKNFILLIVAV